MAGNYCWVVPIKILQLWLYRAIAWFITVYVIHKTKTKQKPIFYFLWKIIHFIGFPCNMLLENGIFVTSLWKWGHLCLFQDQRQRCFWLAYSICYLILLSHNNSLADWGIVWWTDWLNRSCFYCFQGCKKVRFLGPVIWVIDLLTQTYWLTDLLSHKLIDLLTNCVTYSLTQLLTYLLS